MVGYPNKITPIRSEADFSEPLGFTGGFYLDFVVDKYLQRFSICNEILYTNQSFIGTYIDRIADNVSTQYDHSIGGHYIKLNNLFRYRYLLPRFSLFFNGGITNGIIVGQPQNSTVRTTRSFNFENISNVPAIDKFSRHHVGGLFGLGLHHPSQKWSVEIRGERNIGTGGGSVVHAFYFLTGYRF